MPPRKKQSDPKANVTTTSGGRKISVVLPAELAERVERLADVRGDRLTTTVVRLVEAGERQAHEAIREDALASLRTELLEMVEELGVKTRNEVKAQGHRLSHLLARTALESMAGRLTAGHALYKLYGSDQEKAKQLYSGAWTQSVEKLKNPTPGVRTTLNEVSEGAGAQEPAALVNLAEATRQLQQSLGVVSALVERVETLESQQKLTQGSAEQLSDQVMTLTGRLIMALAYLESDPEPADKPAWSLPNLPGFSKRK